MNFQHFSEALISCVLAGRNVVWRPARPAGPQQLLDIAIEAYVPFIRRGVVSISTRFNHTITVLTTITWTDCISHPDFFTNPEVIDTLLRGVADRLFQNRNAHTDFIYIAIVTNLCGRCAAIDQPNMIQSAASALVYYLRLIGGFVVMIDTLDDYIVQNVVPRGL